jgi:hypothetical protein
MTDQTTSPSSDDAPDPLAEPGMMTADTPAATGGDDSQPAEGGEDNQPAEGGEDTAKASEGDDTAPEVPEAYDIKPPDGVELDAALLEAVTPTFKDLGLTNEAAQKLADAYAKDVLPRVVEQVQAKAGEDVINQVVAQRKAWADEWKTDPVLSKPEALPAVSLTIDKVWGPKGTAEGDAFRTFLNDTGLGNHPMLGRGFVKMAEALREGEVIHSDAGILKKRTLADLYEPAFHVKPTG